MMASNAQKNSIWQFLIRADLIGKETSEQRSERRKNENKENWESLMTKYGAKYGDLL